MEISVWSFGEIKRTRRVSADQVPWIDAQLESHVIRDASLGVLNGIM